MSDPSSSSPDKGETLFSASLEIGRFVSDWNHCDQISNFLARTASLDRADPFFYANLLSTILNEVFESIFHYHADEGAVLLALRRNDSDTTFDATIPVSAEAREFYLKVSRDLSEQQPEELFRDHLLGPNADDHAIGFYELAAIYQARIQIEPGAEGKVIHIVIQVRIDDAPQAMAA